MIPYTRYTNIRCQHYFKVNLTEILKKKIYNFIQQNLYTITIINPYKHCVWVSVCNIKKTIFNEFTNIKEILFVHLGYFELCKDIYNDSKTHSSR